LFTLEGEVAQTYFLIRYSDEELRILRESIELGKKAVGLVAARTADGSTAELDLAHAREQVDYAQVEAKRVSERRADLERSLAVLLGVTAERFRLTPLPFDPKPPAIPPGVPSDLLERRPDIVQAERALATRNGESDVPEVAFFPWLPLTGKQGSASSELMALLDWHSNHSPSRDSLWQPPFSAGRIELDADNAGAIYKTGAFDQGALDYRCRIMRAFKEVEGALSRLRLLDQQAQYDATALARSQRAAPPGTVRRQDSLLALAEANNAQRVSLQTRRQLLREKNDRMLTTVALIKTLGGGWSGPRELSARIASPEPSN
jgi:multidrug efflux system outer membrane protein